MKLSTHWTSLHHIRSMPVLSCLDLSLHFDEQVDERDRIDSLVENSRQTSTMKLQSQPYMIFVASLFAPTVPSLPKPQNTHCVISSDSGVTVFPSESDKCVTSSMIPTVNGC